MSLVDEQWAFLQDLVKLVEFIKDSGFRATGGELWRPQITQEHYFKTGKSKTLNSYHLNRLAIDLIIFKDSRLVESPVELAPFGDFWESLSPQNRWGGRFKSFFDGWHFERRPS